ncbi:MAG: hypothetical protein ACKO23_05195 [Gemmataceae bacterium]
MLTIGLRSPLFHPPRAEDSHVLAALGFDQFLRLAGVGCLDAWTSVTLIRPSSRNFTS